MYKNRDRLLIVLVFTLILSVMNAFIFHVVLPDIRMEFRLSPGQASWVISGYMIIYAVGNVLYGKLADRYRMKELLTFGLILMAAGSMLGMFANEFWILVASRMFQAAGGSVIPTIALLIPVRYFEEKERGRALGMVAVGYALGTAFGPIVSGLIAGFIGWRFLFLLAILPLPTIPFYRKYLQEHKGNTEKIDLLGALMVAVFVSMLLLGVTEENIWLIVIGFCFLVLFIWRIHSSSTPFIHPSIFHNKKYTITLLTSFLSTFIAFAYPFLIPMLLDGMHDLSPFMIGMVMFPAALFAAFAGRKIGKLADQRGDLFLIYTSGLMLFTFYIILAVFTTIHAVLILILLLLVNLGQTGMRLAMSNSISRTLPSYQTGIGMGIYSMIFFMGGAIATNVLGKLLEFKTPARFHPLITDSAIVTYSFLFTLISVVTVIVVVMYRVFVGKENETEVKETVDV